MLAGAVDGPASVEGGMARVWYRAVSVLLIRRRRPIGEPTGLRSLGQAGAATIAGSAGAGRIVLALTKAGISCSNLIQAVVPADITPEALGGLDLGHMFDTVVLGSHLVNLPDADRRAAFLELAARQLAPDGALVVEHHPVDWAETAAPTPPTPGAEVGMEDVRREPPFVSAVSTFDIGGRFVRQPFTARVLSDAELAVALDSAGLQRHRRLGPTWIEAARDA
jgi:hypothetical protein